MVERGWVLGVTRRRSATGLAFCEAVMSISLCVEYKWNVFRNLFFTCGSFWSISEQMCRLATDDSILKKISKNDWVVTICQAFYYLLYLPFFIASHNNPISWGLLWYHLVDTCIENNLTKITEPVAEAGFELKVLVAKKALLDIVWWSADFFMFIAVNSSLQCFGKIENILKCYVW